MGNFSAYGDIGTLLLPTALTLLVPHVGWRLTAIIFALPILVFYVFLRHMQKIHLQIAIPKSKQFVSFIRLITHKEYIFAMALTAIDSFASTPVFIFLPFLL